MLGGGRGGDAAAAAAAAAAAPCMGVSQDVNIRAALHAASGSGDSVLGQAIIKQVRAGRSASPPSSHFRTSPA